MVGHSYNPKSSTSQANSKFSTSKAKPKKETAEKWTSDQAHHYSLMCAPVRPNNPHPLSDENRLHHVPDDMRLDYNRPWFSLDYIDPARKYRVRPKGYLGNYIDEGGQSDTLHDDPADNRIPVFVPDYKSVNFPTFPPCPNPFSQEKL